MVCVQCHVIYLRITTISYPIRVITTHTNTMHDSYVACVPDKSGRNALAMRLVMIIVQVT